VFFAAKIAINKAKFDSIDISAAHMNLLDEVFRMFQTIELMITM